MVFSSISFLFFFLPILLACYFLLPRKYKNVCLLLFSLVFYVFGQRWYIILLIISCLVNYICGLAIEKNQLHRRKILLLGIVFDISLLLYFKYMNFFLENLNGIFGLGLATFDVILPLGISFTTFQNISYLVDVYRKDVKPEKKFLKYSMYITFFPQLVAGPIVRYMEISEEIDDRRESMNLLSCGIDRFIVGLAKKVLIADVLYTTYKSILAVQLGMASYWMAAFIYVLHIYYDFSGYSDMAIGLGSMFGFHLRENFDYPLWAVSIKDFWRKWHMSLSAFFKDYVYVPLGGNRKGTVKYVRNLLVVWFLTGLWHGAAWNFVLWGLFFFVILLGEKFLWGRFLKGGIGSHVYSLVIIVVSFVIFRFENLSELSNFLKGMFTVTDGVASGEFLFILKNNLFILTIACLGSTPVIKNIKKKLEEGKMRKTWEVGQVFCLLSVFVLVIAKILNTSFRPFIYFRF